MHAPTYRSDAVRTEEQTPPLAVTVHRASKLSGLGLTTIWAFLRDGRLDAVRVAGVRRTLVSYTSLAKLLTPASASPSLAPRRLGRPRKASANELRP